ncbi:MAG: geranylgeranylglyceryl/heptaprenylglyceryl phosphate synthase [Candidatus Micrarchaeia archaeon]
MQVEKYLKEKIEREKLLFTLIDPIDYKSLEEAIEKGKICCKFVDAVLIGGSIGVQGEVLDYVAKSIREESERNGVPIILFPGNIATVTKYADAIYFMTLLNSRNPYWITQAQALAAPVIKRMKLEAIPVGYIVVEPGGSVGWVGDANLVPRKKPKLAVSMALAGQYIGCHFILMDAGSASELGPIPKEIIAETKAALEIPLIIAGGMRNENEIIQTAKAGADAVQIGTIIQNLNKEKLQKFLSNVKRKLKSR